EVVFAAVLDPGAEVAVGDVVVAEGDPDRGEIRVRTRSVLLEACRERKLEAPLEPSRAGAARAEELRAADVVERMHERVLVTERFRQRDRALAPADGAVDVVRQHAQLCGVAVRHRELASRRQRLEQLDGTASFALRGLLVTVEPGKPREPAVRLALAQAITTTVVLLESAAARLDRFVDLVGEIALVRAPLQELDPAFGLQFVGKAQGAGEMCGSFTVGTEGCCTLGC